MAGSSRGDGLGTGDEVDSRSGGDEMVVLGIGGARGTAQIHAGWNRPSEILLGVFLGCVSRVGARRSLVVSSEKYRFQEGANFSCGSRANSAWRAYLY